MAKKRQDALYFLVAESAAMKRVVDAVARFGPQEEPVLVAGEHGTGRELVARAVHEASPRSRKKFVAVRPTLEEFSESPEMSPTAGGVHNASGGTLLVKDISDLSAAAQRYVKKLLRRDASGEAGASDVRRGGSAGGDVETAVKAKMFGRELYEPLAKQRIDIPPLRERTEDIPVLAERWLSHYAEEVGRTALTLANKAQDRLAAYPWPGNVAELKNIMRRLANRIETNRVEAGDIEEVLPVLSERVPLEDLSFEELVRAKLQGFMRRMDGYEVADLYERILERVEKPLFDLVLEHTAGNQIKASKMLGVNRNTLRKKLEVLGMRTKRKDKADRDVTRILKALG